MADLGWPNSWREKNCPPSDFLPKNIKLDGIWTLLAGMEKNTGLQVGSKVSDVYSQPMGHILFDLLDSC